jgi:hypothetical protein
VTDDSQYPLQATSDTPVHPYSNGKRAFYGLTWTFWTILLIIGGFALLTQSMVGQGLLGWGLAVITMRYAFRIWTWQARHLVFFIIF